MNRPKEWINILKVNILDQSANNLYQSKSLIKEIKIPLQHNKYEVVIFIKTMIYISIS